MKFKIFSFKSIVTYLTMVSFYIATTLSAFAAPLPPISLAQMYSLASQGNVRALRAAAQRGMNIDATDRYGNTGLCKKKKKNIIRHITLFMLPAQILGIPAFRTFRRSNMIISWPRAGQRR